MSKIIVIYASSEGQTAKIAGHIAATLSAAHVVHVQDIAQLGNGIALDDYDGIVMGGSIHGGRVQPELRDFIRAHLVSLQSQLSAFFLVCLTAASREPDAGEKLAVLVNQFVQETGWEPAHLAVFAGALKYSQYGWIKRQMVRYIAKRQGSDTDTSQDYEYTQWDSVHHFAADFAAAIDPQTMRSA